MTTAVETGTRLAERYLVEYEVGRGGMGVVYACSDLLMDDEVAVKLLHTTHGTPIPGTMAWFWAEARALASLDHPGIIRARDFGVLSNKAPYLVMDLVPGVSLTDLVLVTNLGWPAIWLIVDQVLAALGHAHGRGVIHGDLKHSNIMVEILPGDLRVRLLDFGLAWLLRDRFDHRIDGTAREGPTVRPRAGTVGWMAPEQIRGAVPHVGPPTDLYALGCILFQMLTGSEPYESPDLDELQKMHRNAPVPDVPLPEDAPEGVAPFVQRLLAKRPWRRFDFAADARRAFEKFRPAGGPSTWRLPDRSVCDGTSTADGPPTIRGPVSPPNKVEIPLADGAPAGLLGFGPGRFVGREREKNILRKACAALVDSPSGTCRFLWLTGPPGVGKSHLAQWLCEDAHEAGVAIPLRARHNRIATPFDGIVGAVLGHLGLENADRNMIERVLLNIWEVGKTDEEGRQWVAAVGEWLRPTPPGLQMELGPSGKRFVINSHAIRWMVIRYALEKLGESRPIVLWLDDLHRAAPRDFAWLEKLADAKTSLRLLLIATTATGEPEAASPNLHRVAEVMARFGGSSLELETLTESETSDLILSSMVLESEGILTAHRRSKGIPLFALQLVHAWANSGSLEMRAGRYHVKEEALDAVPATTAALWDERLAVLDEDTRMAALAASALGGEVRNDVLVPLLTALDLRATTVLSTLEQLQLLAKLDSKRYRWPHTLLQEHLLRKLAEREDAPRVFREAAFALASYHPAAGNRRLVRHRVTLLIRATEINEAVRVMLDFVARAWERTRDVQMTLDDLAIIDGLARGAWAAMHNRWRAEALRHAGQLDEATTLAFSARRAFAAVNDEANEAQCLRLLGHIASEKGAPLDGRRLVAEAREMMEGVRHDWGRGQCDVVLGELDYLLGDHELAQKELEQASEPLERAGDTLGRGQCLILLGLIALARNDAQSARRYLVDARKGFDRIGYRLGTAQCDVALAHTDHRVGEIEAARARAQNALSSFRLLGTPRGQSGSLRAMAMAALDGGDPAEAQRCAQEAGKIYEQMGDPWGVVESQLLLAQAALARSAPDARTLVEACDVTNLQEREPLQHWHLTYGWLLCREGDYEGALEHMEAAKDALGGGRLGDHAVQLYQRLSAMTWPEALRPRVRNSMPSQMTAATVPDRRGSS